MNEAQGVVGHYINGKEVLKGEIVEHRNPADDQEVVARSHDGNPALMEQAIDAASKAFETWAETTPSVRGEVLYHAAVLLNTPAWRDKFVVAMVAEIGKTRLGANGEVTKTWNILRYMAGLPTHTRESVYYGDQPGVLLYSSREPVGVAGLITPFNFPLAVPVWKIAAALAAGCSVVLKPSPHAPMTSALIVELFREAMGKIDALKKANIGPGLINVVHGGPEVVSALIRNQLIQAVSFTGSTPAGTSVLRQAIDRVPPLDPAHFVAEMGGHNPMLVLADADLGMAVDAAVAGVAVGEGQRCTSTKRIFVDSTVVGLFLSRFLKAIAKLKIGPGSDSSTDVGPLVSSQALERVLAAVEQSVRNGMVVSCGGGRLTEGDWARGNFMMPTVLVGDRSNPGHLALRQEIFGPVVGVSEVHGLEEGIAAVNDSAHRHVASIFTKNLSDAFQFVARARAGMKHVNNTTLGGDVQAPFGGAGGDTSYGPQEMGPRAMEPFQRQSTIGINTSGKVMGGRAR